jgi:hypothetical protein
MGTSKHPLHEALLQSKSYEKCLIYKNGDMQAHEISIDTTKFCGSVRKFSPILLLQMDNCGGNNKNCYLFVFLLLLMSRSV